MFYLNSKITEECTIVKIQRFSIQDGPGIRTTIFLKGCPLRCMWCSNPETQNPSIELAYDQTKCIPNCSECMNVCDNVVIEREVEYIRINRSKCDLCGKCVKVCDHGALTLIGEKMNLSQILEEVEKDRPFYEKSKGGVTISGGEPLYQPEFTKKIVKECKKKNISTTLDTTGYVNWDVLNNVLKYIDLVLYDIKSMDSEKHKKLTGVDNHVILENAKKISKKGIPIILRFPVIPGINDDIENLTYFAGFASAFTFLSGVHLLPYHRIGVSKYSLLDREYLMADLQQPTREHMIKIKRTLESFGINPLIIS
jgi:pyruvate formate lyase activating enzyme